MFLSAPYNSSPYNLQQVIQIGTGHQILVVYTKQYPHLVGYPRPIFDRLVVPQTHLKLEKLAQFLDFVEMNTCLVVQEQMSRLTHISLDAQAFGQHAIQHVRLLHLDDIELGQFGAGHIGPYVLDELRGGVLRKWV